MPILISRFSALGRLTRIYRTSANEDDPFDSDSDDEEDDDEFMPRGKGNATLETKKGPQFTVKKVPDTPPSSTTTEEKDPGAGAGEAQKPKVRGVSLPSSEELGCPNGSAQDAQK